MEFKITGKMMRVLWQSETSALCSVQESFTSKGKESSRSWAIFTNEPLNVGSTYTISGYITEAPNKGFINEQGKVAYKANFNATQVLHADETYSFGEPPKERLEEIPF